MNVINIPLNVTAFEITQDQSRKTDYQLAGLDDFPEMDRERVEMWLWGMHKPLAQNLPEDEVILCCPQPHVPELICICRYMTLRGSSGRPFLQMQGMFVSQKELELNQLDPLSLYDSGAWSLITSGHYKFIVNCSPFHPRFHSNRLIERIGNVLMNQASSSQPMRMEWKSDENILSVIRHALHLLPAHEKAKVGFAVNLPPEVNIPAELALRIDKAPGAASLSQPLSRQNSAPQKEERNHQSLSVICLEYCSIVDKIAVSITNIPSLGPEWRSRLWNRCEDLKTALRIQEQNPNRTISKSIEKDGLLLMTEVGRQISSQPELAQNLRLYHDKFVAENLRKRRKAFLIRIATVLAFAGICYWAATQLGWWQSDDRPGKKTGTFPQSAVTRNKIS